MISTDNVWHPKSHLFLSLSFFFLMARLDATVTSEVLGISIAMLLFYHVGNYCHFTVSKLSNQLGVEI